MQPLCSRLNPKDANDATKASFCVFQNFQFFFGFSMYICMYNAMHETPNNQSKHDQILGTSPKLKSHSLCVMKKKGDTENMRKANGIYNERLEWYLKWRLGCDNGCLE